jgi:hypothetical protein
MENKQLVFPSRQYCKTPVGFGQGFRSKGQCDIAAASSIPNLAAADFYLFPGLKSAFPSLLTSLRMRCKS